MLSGCIMNESAGAFLVTLGLETALGYSSGAAAL